MKPTTTTLTKINRNKPSDHQANVFLYLNLVKLNSPEIIPSTGTINRNTLENNGKPMDVINIILK